MSAYPVLRIDTFTHPEAKVGIWQSAMTYKFVGAIRGIGHLAAVPGDRARRSASRIGLVIEVARKLLAALGAATSASSPRASRGFAVGWIVDAVLLVEPLRLVDRRLPRDLDGRAWFAAGSVAELAARAAPRSTPHAPRSSGDALPEDMSTPRWSAAASSPASRSTRSAPAIAACSRCSEYGCRARSNVRRTAPMIDSSLSSTHPRWFAASARRSAGAAVGSPALRAQGGGERAVAGAALPAPGRLGRRSWRGWRTRRPATSCRWRRCWRGAGGRRAPTRRTATRARCWPRCAGASRSGCSTRCWSRRSSRRARTSGWGCWRAGSPRGGEGELGRVLRGARRRRGAPRRDLPRAGAPAAADAADARRAPGGARPARERRSSPRCRTQPDPLSRDRSHLTSTRCGRPAFRCDGRRKATAPPTIVAVDLHRRRPERQVGAPGRRRAGRVSARPRRAAGTVLAIASASSRRAPPRPAITRTARSSVSVEPASVPSASRALCAVGDHRPRRASA